MRTIFSAQQHHHNHLYCSAKIMDDGTEDVKDEIAFCPLLSPFHVHFVVCLWQAQGIIFLRLK